MSYIGNTSTTQAFTPAVDYFSGNASTTAFTLSRPVASVAQVQVVVNNVAQNPSSAYTISSNTITFTSAPSSGTNNIYVYYTSPITQVIAPGQGTVTATSMASSTGTGAGVFQTSPTITTPTINQITSAASTNLTLQSAGTTAVTIDTSQNVGIGTTSPSSYGAFVVRKSNTVQGVTNASAQFSDAVNSALFIGHTSGAANLITESSNITFGFTNGSATTERMRIDSSGRFGFAGTVGGNFGSQASFYNPGSNSWCAEFNTGVNGNIVLWQRTNTYPCTQIQFYGFNGAVATNAGNITLSGSTTASYNTSSDYRMKENVQPMTGALAKVALLKPVVYKWKAEFGGQDGQGFIAHELQEVVPDCVTGAKDAVDADGNPVYQGVDTSFLVATLTAAIQELKAINDTQAETINALTARIEALENK